MGSMHTFSAILTTGMLAFAAGALANEANTLQALLKQNQALIAAMNDTKLKEVQIGKAKLEINGAADVLKRAETNFRRNAEGLGREVQYWEGQAQRVQNNGCPWGGKAEASYAEACNAQMRKIQAWARELKDKDNGMEEYARRLQAERAEVERLTLEWARKQDAVNRQARLVEQKRAEWQQRYNAFVFQSEAYRRLRVSVPLAQHCRELTGMGSHDELRNAAQCLQHLWDGARR